MKKENKIVMKYIQDNKEWSLNGSNLFDNPMNFELEHDEYVIELG